MGLFIYEVCEYKIPYTEINIFLPSKITPVHRELIHCRELVTVFERCQNRSPELSFDTTSRVDLSEETLYMQINLRPDYKSGLLTGHAIKRSLVWFPVRSHKVWRNFTKTVVNARSSYVPYDYVIYDFDSKINWRLNKIHFSIYKTSQEIILHFQITSN